MDEKILKRKIARMKQGMSQRINILRANFYKNHYKILKAHLTFLERICHVNNYKDLHDYILSHMDKGSSRKTAQSAIALTASTYGQQNHTKAQKNDKFHVQKMSDIKGVLGSPNIVRLLHDNHFIKILTLRLNGKPVNKAIISKVPKLQGSNIGSTIQALEIYAKKIDPQKYTQFYNPSQTLIGQLASHYRTAILKAMKEYLTTKDDVYDIARKYRITTGFVRDCHSIEAIQEFNHTYNRHMLPKLHGTNVHNVADLMKAIDSWYKNHVTFTRAARPFSFSASTLENAARNISVIQMYNYVYHQNLEPANKRHYSSHKKQPKQLKL